MEFTFTPKFSESSSDEIWKFLCTQIKVNQKFYSIRESKEYTITALQTDNIYFKGKERNSQKAEKINKQNIAIVLKGLKIKRVFKTSSSSDIFKKANVHRMRSPIFALFVRTEIIYPFAP